MGWSLDTLRKLHRLPRILWMLCRPFSKRIVCHAMPRGRTSLQTDNVSRSSIRLIAMSMKLCLDCLNNSVMCGYKAMATMELEPHTRIIQVVE